MQRMQEGNLPKAPIWDDIRTLPTNQLDSIDIIYGGFPCQDFSVAGNGAGLEGKRSSLFFEIMRISKEVKPKFIFLENVPAITTRGGLRVIREVAEMGYDCRWCVISAAGVGALHRRERWFLLAHSKHNGTLADSNRESVGECTLSRENPQEQKESIGTVERASSVSTDVANSKSKRLERFGERTFNTEKEQSRFASKCNDGHSEQYWQKAVSEICRTTDGVSNRVDRLRALGNAVVPLQAKTAFEILIGINANSN